MSQTQAQRKRTTSPRRSQERGERTRARILEVAEELFARHGYSGASLDAIAAKAEMHKPGICYYFASKRALYEAVVGEALGSLEELARQALSSSGSPRERLLRSVENWVDALAARPTAACLLLHEAANPDPKGVPQAFQGPGARTASMIENAFHELLPDAHPDDWFHFESTIAGATLFFATGMQRLQSGRGESDVQHSMERHKTLLMRTARALLRELRPAR
ncbi:MAG: TetR/AcrR family transcriptional regulator [Deltaproteobacteria bacterium]|nr:TetR/AcrR family transcriptional regulator [Deltaproteobacteria bacterium]MBW2360686.1 TetR/AcrR family transcriptional regulator [Deltaproteobacteria bacterium]